METRWGKQEFFSSYRGARFKVNLQDAVPRNIALRDFEREQIAYMIGSCKRIKPDLFIDIGAHSAVYSCILLVNGLVPRAVMFEPDSRNLARLRENILANDLTEKAEVHPAAAGSKKGTAKFASGSVSNTGMSHLATESEESDGEVEVVAIDDVLPERGKRLAIKMDVENHEVEALRGMERLLRGNSGIIQIECSMTRDAVVSFMKNAGYDEITSFHYDVVFEKQ